MECPLWHDYFQISYLHTSTSCNIVKSFNRIYYLFVNLIPLTQAHSIGHCKVALWIGNSCKTSNFLINLFSGDTYAASAPQEEMPVCKKAKG